MLPRLECVANQREGRPRSGVLIDLWTPNYAEKGTFLVLSSAKINPDHSVGAPALE